MCGNGVRENNSETLRYVSERKPNKKRGNFMSGENGAKLEEEHHVIKIFKVNDVSWKINGDADMTLHTVNAAPSVMFTKLEDLEDNFKNVEPKYFDEDDFDIVLDNCGTPSPPPNSEPYLNGDTELDNNPQHTESYNNSESLNGYVQINGMVSPSILLSNTKFKTPVVNIKRIPVPNSGLKRSADIKSDLLFNKIIISPQKSLKSSNVCTETNLGIKNGPVLCTTRKHSPKQKSAKNNKIRKSRFSLDKEKRENAPKSTKEGNPLKSRDTSSDSGSDRRFSERRFQGEKPYICNHCPLTFSSFENRGIF